VVQIMSLKESLWDCWSGFFTVRKPFFLPTNGTKAPKDISLILYEKYANCNSGNCSETVLNILLFSVETDQNVNLYFVRMTVM